MRLRWIIQLLGELRAEGAGRALTHFRTQKTGALFAYLACFPQRRHSRELLAELFWPDSEREAGLQSVRMALSALRRELEPAGLPWAVPPGSVLQADRFAVRLNRDAVVTDVGEFEAALRVAGAAPGSAERARRLAAALELYRGELLPHCDESWVLAERHRLSELFLEASGQLSALVARAGDLPRAIEYARRAVGADPTCEAAHRELMRLLVAAGQPDAAARQYRELQRILELEFGDTPSAATQALWQQVQPFAMRAE